MLVDINPIPRHPVFTPRQAIAYGLAEVGAPDKDYTGMCLHSCAWFYGFQSSGVKDASSFWRGTPSSQKVAGDMSPPAGAIALWTGGSSGHGHASVVAGRRGGGPMILSTDIRRKGKVDVVPLNEISARWGLKYEGWAKPYFPLGPKDDRHAPRVYDSTWAWGTVYVAKLREGQRNSDSVRRLQHRLGIPVTGTWDVDTTAAVALWKRRHGWPDEEGRAIGPAQAHRMFGGNYFAVAAPRAA